MDKINKKVSEYYINLASVYQLGLACQDCDFEKCTQNCYKNKEYCAERLYLIMKRILGG